MSEATKYRISSFNGEKTAVHNCGDMKEAYALWGFLETVPFGAAEFIAIEQSDDGANWEVARKRERSGLHRRGTAQPETPWSELRGDSVTSGPVLDRARRFLADLVEACERHGLSISHEDGHGAFKLVKYDEAMINWLCDASIAFEGE